MYIENCSLWCETQWLSLWSFANYDGDESIKQAELVQDIKISIWAVNNVRWELVPRAMGNGLQQKFTPPKLSDLLLQKVGNQSHLIGCEGLPSQRFCPFVVRLHCKKQLPIPLFPKCFSSKMKCDWEHPRCCYVARERPHALLLAQLVHFCKVSWLQFGRFLWPAAREFLLNDTTLAQFLTFPVPRYKDGFESWWVYKFEIKEVHMGGMWLRTRF